MTKIIDLLKNPLIWLAFLLSFLAFYNNSKEHKEVIRSDGRGYYAYLPAIFIYNDANYDASYKAEARHKGNNFNQAYLFKDENGKIYNKYFPGLAIMQAPFFTAACAVSWVSGQPVDGYSDIFQYFFLIGSLFYTILGIFVFYRVLHRLFPDEDKRLKWIIIAVYLASTLIMYTTNTTSFTHHFTFCLFGLFALQILNVKSEFTVKRIFIIGLILGLITLLRPTNILVVLIIPFVLTDYKSLVAFFKSLFSNSAKPFFVGVAGFFAILSLLFMVWKWQSGHWFVWSYSGEGFNFLHPELIANLFEYHIGLFIHTPLLILSVIGTIVLFRQNKYQALMWWLYFMVNAWIISAWWCWDYESTYGNRPFTEHLFFLAIPLIYFLKSAPKVAIVLYSFFTLLGVVRYTEYITGYLVDQRFTEENYFVSMKFWESENSDRWRFPRSCNPFGRLIETNTLLDQAFVRKVEKHELYTYSVETQLKKPRTSERYFYRVEMEKRVESPLKDVVLVVESGTNDRKKCNYAAIPLFNDRLESLLDWEKISFNGLIQDNFQDFDYLKIYIWNKGEEEFHLRNVKITLEKYKV